MTQAVASQEEFVSSLQKIGEQLSIADEEDFAGLYALRTFLKDWDYGHEAVELSTMLGPRALTAFWFLYQLVIEDIWLNLGGGNLGIPVSSGKPLLVKISHSLARFISAFQEERMAAMMEELIQAVGAYFELLNLCDSEFRKGVQEQEWTPL